MQTRHVISDPSLFPVKIGGEKKGLSDKFSEFFQIELKNIRRPLMILNTERRNDQVEQRLELRCSSATLANVITEGTNCSRFEAEIITEKAEEIFQLGDYSQRSSLQPGQMIWQAIDADEPPGKPLRKCKYKRIVLTVHRLEEDREVRYKEGMSAKRGQQVLRMASEAFDQGMLLTVEDLALLLDCNERTIRNDIKSISQKLKIVIPTRGNKCDIGPGITHREKVIELFIQGNDPVQIGRDLTHSLKAVERYIHSFCRIVYCQEQVHNTLQTAQIVGVSVALVNRCLELKNKFYNRPEYKERIEEIQALGTQFWEAQDSKKKLGRKLGRQK